MLNKKYLVPSLSVVGIIAGITAGGALSGTIANAATNSGSTTNSSSSSTTAPTDGTNAAAPSGPHQYNGKTEAALTGDDLTKATAAAQKAVSGATVERAETDVDGDGTYEVHMKKSDGSMVTVFLDASFNVTSQTNGMSAKNPGPANGQQNGQNAPSATQSR